MCGPILVTLLKMRPHDNQSSLKNATTDFKRNILICLLPGSTLTGDRRTKKNAVSCETVTHAPDARKYLIYELIFDPCEQKISL